MPSLTMPLTVRSPAGDTHLMITAPGPVTFAAVRPAVLRAAGLPDEVTLHHGLGPVPAAAVLGRAPLLAGLVLSTTAETGAPVDGPVILACVAGPDAGAFVALDGDPVVVGRDTGGGLDLADPELSRRHLRLERHGAGWQAVDLGSRNGVHVEGVNSVDPGAVRREGAARGREGAAERGSGVARRHEGVTERRSGIARRHEGVAERRSEVARREEGVPERRSGVDRTHEGAGRRHEGVADEREGVAERREGLTALRAAPGPPVAGTRRTGHQLRRSRSGAAGSLGVLADRDDAGGIVDGPAVPVPAGSLIRAGASRLRIVVHAERRLTLTPDGLGHLRVARPPRVLAPFQAELSPAPGAAPERIRRPLPLLAAAIGALVGAVVAWVTGMWMFLLFAALGPVYLLAGALGDRVGGRRSHRRAVADHRRQGADHDASVAAGVDADRCDAWDRHPDPALLARRCRTRSARLWERRPGDPEFAHLVLAVGNRPARLPMTSPPSVSDVPLTVGLLDVGVLGLTGRARSTVRSLLVQLVALHSPADVGLVLFSSAADLLPLRDIPHATGGPLGDGAQVRTAGEVAPALRTLTSALTFPDRPALTVLVLDGAGGWRRHPGMSQVLDAAADPRRSGMAVLCLEEERELLPAECRAVADVSPAGVSLRGGPVFHGGHVGVRAGHLAGVAADLAPLRDIDAALGGLPARCTLGDWEQVGRDAAALRQRWDRPSVRTIIGVGRSGPVEIDLDRDGPHLLIAGTTGAGKSELLQTLVAGLAAAAPPSLTSFLLVDYKGGAAFGGLTALPHTAGLITDLDPELAARALTSLRAEIRTREGSLARAGFADLAAWRAAAADAPARLVIVVDEFATLATELPEFLAGLIDVSRRGRSLGLHLVLATQRPAGVVTPALRANIGARICLRVSDDAESRDVIGAPDAARLPHDHPGRAVLRTGSGRLTVFQAARVTVRPDRAVRVARRDETPPPSPTGPLPVRTDLLSYARGPGGWTPDGAPAPRRSSTADRSPGSSIPLYRALHRADGSRADGRRADGRHADGKRADPHQADPPGAAEPDVALLETAVTGGSLPETALPETPAPETPLPETALPATAVIETAASDTPLPETAAPETPAPKTAAPKTAVNATAPPTTALPGNAPRERAPLETLLLPTDLDALISATRQIAPAPARRPWLPALPALLPPDDAILAGWRESSPGASAGPPIGLLDQPEEQRQRPYPLPATSTLVVGPPGSGRTSALRACAGAAAESGAGILVVDTTGALADLARWPCTTTLLDDRDPVLLARLVERLRMELDARSTSAARAAAPLLLAVDGWETVVAALDTVDYGAAAATLSEIAARGPALGIRVVASGASRAAHSRYAASFPTVLTLGDPDRFGQPRADACPGRAKVGAHHLQLVLMPPGTPHGRRAATGTDQLVVRPLPPFVPFADLPPASDRTAWLGMGGDDAGPVGLDLSGRGGGFLITGPRRSGTSTALHVLARGAVDLAVPVIELARRQGADLPGVRSVDPGPHAEELRDLFTRHEGPLLVLVDQVDEWADGPVAALLTRFLAVAGPGQFLAAGCRTDRALRGGRSLIGEVAAFRHGVLLHADTADGVVLDAAIPRRRAAGGAGRGHLVRAGQVTPVQIARAPEPLTRPFSGGSGRGDSDHRAGVDDTSATRVYSERS